MCSYNTELHTLALMIYGNSVHFALKVASVKINNYM